MKTYLAVLRMCVWKYLCAEGITAFIYSLEWWKETPPSSLALVKEPPKEKGSGFRDKRRRPRGWGVKMPGEGGAAVRLWGARGGQSATRMARLAVPVACFVITTVTLHSWLILPSKRMTLKLVNCTFTRLIQCQARYFLRPTSCFPGAAVPWFSSKYFGALTTDLFHRRIINGSWKW